MASRPSLISGIWQNIKKSINIARSKEIFVGADMEGNKYFERPPDASKGVKHLRRVEGPTTDQFTAPTVPTEWMTWLQGRRNTPPTDQEIEKNYITMLKTQQRAHELEKQRQDEPSELPLSKTAPPSAAKRDFPRYEEYEQYNKEFNERVDQYKER